MNETESAPENSSWYELNKDKAKANSKAWREAHPERVRELKRKWRRIHTKKKARLKSINPHPNLTEAEYNELLFKQGNFCGVCEKKPTPKRKFEVDREYRTGRVRGLLCKDCFLAANGLKTIKMAEFFLRYMRGNTQGLVLINEQHG